MMLWVYGSVLYPSEGTKVMLTPNLWDEEVLHNSDKVQVVKFVYQDANDPRNGDLPESVVVQFR